jgi:hypothetical protein
MDDHLGSGSGHYMFNEAWVGQTINLLLEEEDDRFWRGRIITRYEDTDGWLQVELMKICFDVEE